MKVLGLELGTDSVRAAVLDVTNAAPLGPVERVAYPLDHPTPDAAEVPPERFWKALTTAARRAATPVEGIAGVGLTCADSGLVLLDHAGRLLGPIWLQQDRRSRPAARQAWAALGESYRKTTGNRPLPGRVSATSFRQRQRHDPYLGQRVGTYLHLNGWIGFHLTGERAFDPANASCTGLFNTMTDRQWSEKWCDYFEVERTWLPPVLDGTRTLGPLRSAVAGELGVPPGIPVKLGTTDTSSAMLAAGMLSGDLLHVVGTVQSLAVLTNTPRPDARRWTGLSGVGAGFVQTAQNPVGEGAVEWLHQLCFRELSDEQFHQQALPAALERGTRITLDPPDLSGDALELEARRAAFRDVTLATDRLDLLAAVVHEMRRQHERATDALGEGRPFARVFVTGAWDKVRALLPEYPGALVRRIEDGALRGVARLFEWGA